MTRPNRLFRTKSDLT